MDETAIRALVTELFAALATQQAEQIKAVADSAAALADKIDGLVIPTMPNMTEFGERIDSIARQIGAIESELATLADPAEVDPNSPDGVRTRWIDKVLPKYFGTDYPGAE